MCTTINAPPDAATATAWRNAGTLPSWWTAEWGYNEWNRVYDGSQTASQISNLAAGDGKQVVSFPEFTVLRTLSGTNTLTNTVAYSFPEHPKEKPSGSKGDAGSMDSPFDFVWKMRMQKHQMAEEYNAQGNPRTDDSDSAWLQTRSPQNKWNNYVKGQLDGTVKQQTYIPSLGLFYGIGGSFIEGDLPDKNDASWNWDYTFEAGTDCIGFAQRAASYVLAENRRSYQWYKLPPGIMETTTTDYEIVQNGYGDTTIRNYPSDEGEAATEGKDWPHVADNVLHNRSSNYDSANYRKTKGNLSDEENASLIERLLKVVPGDIWVKDTSSATDLSGDAMREHIAIVAYVPPNAYRLSAVDLMDQIILIEGTFGNKIQSVIKKLSVGMYNNNIIPKDTPIYSNFSAPVVGANQGIPLYCQSWAIRRLK